MFRSLKSLFITFKCAVAALRLVVGVVLGLVLFLGVSLYVYREVHHDALVVDSFSVPKSIEESGLTPEVVSNRIGDALRRIEIEANTRLRKDNLAYLRDEGAMPNVEIPGTKLGLKTLVDITRAIFGIHPKHVGGDIVTCKNPALSAKQPQINVTIYITQGRNRSQAVSRLVNSDDMDEVVWRTAESVLEQVNPYILAVYVEDHRDPDRAVTLIRRIVRDESNDREHRSAALALWGRILSKRQKYNEAIEKYKQAMALAPKYNAPYIDRGNTLFDQQKYDEAIEWYKQAIALDPEFRNAYNNWGNALSRQQKYDEAIEKYKQAIALDPGYALAYDNWGNALSDQQKYDEALEKYKKAALVLDFALAYDHWALAYDRWGIVLSIQRKYEEAIERYRQAITLNPNDALAYHNWGEALDNQGKHEEAIEKYTQAVALYPDWGKALNDLGKYEEAIERYRQAIALNPKDALDYSNWGKALNDQGKYQESIEMYKQAIALNPKLALIYNNWGNAFRIQRKYEEAIEMYKQAIALDPKLALAYNDWGHALSAQGKHEETEEKFAQRCVFSQ